MAKLRGTRWLGFALIGAGGVAIATGIILRAGQGDDDGPLTLSEPAHLCVGQKPKPPCRSPESVERFLRSTPLEILKVAPTPSGSQGATLLTLRAPNPELVVKAKWRPWSAADAYNDPAADLAAYHVQKLVLAPADYVVPPATGRCFPIEVYRAHFGRAIEPFPEASCVLGFLSYWLTGSITLQEARQVGLFAAPNGIWNPDPRLYDPKRFASEPHYRRAIANVNVVAYLVHNRDAHTGQFVLYREPLHLFLVDNSVSFSVRGNEEMIGRQNLAELVVPAIPKGTAERIRGLSRADIDALLVLEEYERKDGKLRPTESLGPIGDLQKRIRTEGDRVQIGLMKADVRALIERLERLQEALRTDRLGTFE